MKEFEIDSLIILLKQIKNKEKNKNINVEDVTIEFSEDGLAYVRSYIGDKLVNKINVQFEIVD